MLHQTGFGVISRLMERLWRPVGHSPLLLVLLLIWATSVQGRAGDSPSPVCHLPLNGDLRDATGNGHDGKAHGVKFVHDDAFGECASLDGGAYVEILSHPDLSIHPDKGFAVLLWICPSTLNFKKVEGADSYVHFLGKGEKGSQEWALRLYNKNSPRPNRVSFYIFNRDGGWGAGSFFQDPLRAMEWIQVAGVVEGKFTFIYKNGVLQRRDNYEDYRVKGQNVAVHPEPGSAPLRLGTRDQKSFFEGKMRDLRIYSTSLSAVQIKLLYDQSRPR